jgi:hypothetical protein
MSTSTYLVFGDLHGRILPAFRLACAYARECERPVAGLLQVGDLGYFPDPGRLDSATKRHAERDPLELGAQDIAEPSKLADEVFADPDCPEVLWFTAGNHEDFDALHERAAASAAVDFAVDAYGRVRCIRDGAVAVLPDDLRVGALWGVDSQQPNARRRVPPAGYIKPRCATQLAGRTFDVLLTHDSPAEVVFPLSGSEEITALIQLAQPAFAFFGHYDSDIREVEGDFRATRVYHLHGFELRHRGGCAEPASVGALTWNADGRQFEYLDDDWLRTFTRHNWRHR